MIVCGTDMTLKATIRNKSKSRSRTKNILFLHALTRDFSFVKSYFLLLTSRIIDYVYLTQILTLNKSRKRVARYVTNVLDVLLIVRVVFGKSCHGKRRIVESVRRSSIYKICF